MGSPENESDRDDSEGQQHEVAVAKPFAVSKFEVTFEEWDACAAAAACPQVPDHWGRGKMPVINGNWIDAKQYVNWLKASRISLNQRPSTLTTSLMRAKPIPENRAQ
jgi:formylglycine-generating enzyme required for sulfatase activity